jgi:hypothetical protein
MTERTLLERMLVDVSAASGRIRESTITMCPTRVGSRWDQELLVVGRAPNGWDCGFSVNELGDPEFRRRAVLDSLPQTPDPMEWLAKAWAGEVQYKAKRSSFWRVARTVLLRLKGLDDLPQWHSHLAWTNLCKLAPAEGRNPSTGLWHAQLPASIELLNHEIRELQPKRIVIMTGSDWIDPFRFELAAPDGHWSYVVRTGRIGLPGGRSADVVVSKHPERKPEAQIVSEVLAAFAALT